MISKVCEAATRGSNSKDFPWADFCAFKFNELVELAAICANCAFSCEAIFPDIAYGESSSDWVCWKLPHQLVATFEKLGMAEHF
jgi:hypothetical protein